MAVLDKGTPGSTCVVGVGACTPVGATARAAAAAARARLPWFVEHPYLIDRTGERVVTATSPCVSPEILGVSRWTALATAAAAEALAPLGGVAMSTPMPLFLGLPSPRPGLPHELRRALEIALARTVSAACTAGQIACLPNGHAAGLMAAELACVLLATGEAELCLVGGCDSYLETETLEWLDFRRQLRSSANRWGFVPGEAASFCLLASNRAAQRYKLPVLGRVLGVRTASEEKRTLADGVNLGEGLSRVTRDVLAPLPTDRRIDRILSDLNGERHRVDECGFTLTRVGKRLRGIPHPESPASCWGDVGAASGPLLMSLALLVGRRRSPQGALSLLWTSSEGGARCAALVETTASPSAVENPGPVSLPNEAGAKRFDREHI